MFRRSVAAAALAAGMMAASSAGAAVVVDVDHFFNLDLSIGYGTQGGGASLKGPGYDVEGVGYQTWLVGQTGTLAQIDLFTAAVKTNNVPFNPVVTLSVYRGGDFSAPGTTLLAAIDRNMSDLALGLNAFDFSSFGIGVTAGETMTMSMQVQSCGELTPCQISWGTIGSSHNNGVIPTYLDGQLFTARNGGAPEPVIFTFEPGDLEQPQPDMNFRTYVDVGAIPEPSTWAMMILGFGAAGYALRRRHATSSLLPS